MADSVAYLYVLQSRWSHYPALAAFYAVWTVISAPVIINHEIVNCTCYKMVDY